MFRKPIDLVPVDIDQIVVSDKFNHFNNGFRYFIDYKEGEFVELL